MNTNFISTHACSLLHRAGVAVALACILSLSMRAHTVLAQSYPSKPVRIIIGFPPGGATDIVSRLLAVKYNEEFKHPFIVDNRPGAGGVIGTDLVAKSAPDGYTIHVGTFGALVISPAMRKVPYDPIGDFAPISEVILVPMVVVARPSLSADSIKDLIALAKSRPGTLNYASAGVGGPGHLAAELFKTMANADIVHVPYKGGTEGITAVLAGQVDILVGMVSTVLPAIRSGKARALAVTDATRAALLPDVPTIAEAGIQGYEASNWYGMLAPANTPRPIIKALYKATINALNLPDVRDTLLKQGLDPAPSSSPAAFAAHIKSDTEKWAKVVKALKLSIN